MSEIPSIEMSLFQMASNVVGTENISRIVISDDKGFALNQYDYSDSSFDPLPSVVFSIDSIVNNNNLSPSNSKTPGITTGFPGLI